jgi:hypothetical protein
MASELIDIRKEALKHYKTLLLSYTVGQTNDFFPLCVRHSKPQRRDDRATIKNKIAYLESDSAKSKGFGFIVEWEERGSQSWNTIGNPTRVYFPDEQNFLKYIEKKEEYETFKKTVAKIELAVPPLKKWVSDNTSLVVKYEGLWDELISVCLYFMTEHVRNRYYIRELPIPKVHTKFIENNQFIVSSLLDFLVPEKIDPSAKSFHKKYGLKDKERLIRIRILCPEIRSKYDFNDFSIPISLLSAHKINCSSILLAENEMNFLTFPEKTGFIAVWNGGGHNIHDLPCIEWLAEKKLFYFGDIDVAGFDILSKFRSKYNEVAALLMTRAVFDQFYEGGKSDKIVKPDRRGLLHEEIELLADLIPNNLRLEQEKIPQAYINDVIRNL